MPPSEQTSKKPPRRDGHPHAERWTCVICGHVASRNKVASESSVVWSHHETDTRSSSASFVRHTCKSCVKVIKGVPLEGSEVRTKTCREIARAITPQFRDVNRALHVCLQVTLDRRNVDIVPDLLGKHVQTDFMKHSSVACTDFVRLFGDAVDNVMSPCDPLQVNEFGLDAH